VPGVDIEIPLATSEGSITLVGMKDASSSMAYDASRLYARNISNLVALMTVDGELEPDFTDDVVNGACLTRAGEVNHAATREALEAASSSQKGTN
jgi:NAD(P) transhydrogenase subunit alpha